MTTDRFSMSTPSLPGHPAPRRRRGGFARRIIARAFSLVLSGALLGGVAAGTFYGVNRVLYPDSVQSVPAGEEPAALQASTDPEGTASGAVLTTLGSASGTSVRYGMDVSDVAQNALPSVVSITNISVQEVRSYFYLFGPGGPGQTQLKETTSCGSGVIIAADETYLYIVTNQHVVADASTLSVGFVDNTVCEAQLCGTDETADIAVLKVALSDLSQDTLSQICVIPIGDSDALEVGEQVVAIGNALGYGQSVTTGIVSALDRMLANDSGTTSSYIQTDAAINPGNSGGALLNLDGALIGINTAKLSSTDVEGMGYAIPISDVLPLIRELMTQTTPLSQTTQTTPSSSYWEGYWSSFWGR